MAEATRDGQAPGEWERKTSLTLFLSDSVEHRILSWAGPFKWGHWERRPQSVETRSPSSSGATGPVLPIETSTTAICPGKQDTAPRTSFWTSCSPTDCKANCRQREYHTRCINFEGWPHPWRKEGIFYHKMQKNCSVCDGLCVAFLDVHISCQSCQHPCATSE